MTSTTISMSSAVTSADGTTIGYHTLGAGQGVIIVGGSLSTGQDYVAFGRALASSFEVHLMDRRGRGTSGPQGPEYSIGKEVEDLRAVADATGATRVFGHSYGGLVALETARRSGIFTRVAVYEPGISIGGSISASWMTRYEHLLSQGDTRGAFAVMVQGAGFAPRPVAKMPWWCIRPALRLVVRKGSWQHMEPLLQTNLAEHAEVVHLDSTVTNYESIISPVLILGGTKSPTIVTSSLEGLHRAIKGSTFEMIEGLNHVAPESAPRSLSKRILRYFSEG